MLWRVIHVHYQNSIVDINRDRCLNAIPRTIGKGFMFSDDVIVTNIGIGRDSCYDHRSKHDGGCNSLPNDKNFVTYSNVNIIYNFF